MLKHVFCISLQDLFGVFGVDLHLSFRQAIIQRLAEL